MSEQLTPKQVTETLQIFKQCNDLVTLLIATRKDAKFTQEFMAKCLGVSRKKIYEFEKGKFDFELMCWYADKFSIDIKLIFEE